MKRIYIRAGVSPLDNFDAAEMLSKNLIGDNVGNLIYAYGIFRTLMQEDTEIVPNYYTVSPEDADRINEEFDYFVIPLADAFRRDFMNEMRATTKLIKKLKIPCIVIGVGLRAPFNTDSNISFPFDNDVKEFVRAVLDKSAIFGVRGEITSSYLKSLGFREEIDHTVIGCPSMYAYGKHLNIKDVNLTEQSRISINSSVMSPVAVQNFLIRSMKQIPDHYFLPQRIQELRLLYTGLPYTHKQKCKMYPCNISDDIYKEDRVKFFLNAPTWIDFLKTADLSIGGRMHGNIAATIAGTPAVLIPHDARMKELAEYHNLTHVWAKDITDKTDIFDLVSKLDFQQATRCHEANFNHYIDFLNKNKLPHIYSEDMNRSDAPLDQKLASIQLNGEVTSIRHCTIDEMAERWKEFAPKMDKQLTSLKSEVRKSKLRIQDLEKQTRQVPSLKVTAKHYIKKILNKA